MISSHGQRLVSRRIVMVMPVMPQHACADVFQEFLLLFTLGKPRRPHDLCRAATDLAVAGPASELQLRSRFCTCVEDSHDSQVAELVCRLGSSKAFQPPVQLPSGAALCSSGNSVADWLCKARVAALAADPTTPAVDLLCVQRAGADMPLANG